MNPFGRRELPPPPGQMTPHLQRRVGEGSHHLVPLPRLGEAVLAVLLRLVRVLLPLADGQHLEGGGCWRDRLRHRTPAVGGRTGRCCLREGPRQTENHRANEDKKNACAGFPPLAKKIVVCFGATETHQRICAAMWQVKHCI